RAPAGDRAGARLAGGAKPGRVDAGELHGRARIRFQRFRACAEGLGAVGRLVTAIIPIESGYGTKRTYRGQARHVRFEGQADMIYVTACRLRPKPDIDGT